MYDSDGNWLGDRPVIPNPEAPVVPGAVPTHPFPNQQGYAPTTSPARKKSRRNLVIGLAVAFLVALGFCIGGGVLLGSAADEVAKQGTPSIGATETTATDPAATAQAKDSETGDAVVAKIGQALIVDGAATESWTPTKVEKPTVDEWGDKAKRGQYLLVHFKVSVTEGSTFICSCALQFVDSAGKVYDPGYSSFKKREELEATEVAAGQNVEGWVAFDVPKAALKGGRIQLKADTFSDKYGYWAL